MRKLLSVILVLAMVLGLASTAFAFTDVTATAQVGPAEKLTALGILKGYADGTFRPNDPITRAEFAAVIVRTMGLESAAKLINNPTKFADVTANYAWAYGYINIASSKNIIKGDPDGKFRPGDKVSYAEAITMLLRAANWDAECSTLDWPAGFVMKAVEFGITDGVTFDANKPAARGDVAVLTYNALETPIAGYNDLTKSWFETGDTITSKYLKATEFDAVVVATNAVDSNIAAGKVKVEYVNADDDVVTSTYALPAGVSADSLIGHDIRIITSGTSALYLKDTQDADNIVKGTVVSNDGSTIVVTVGDEDQTYTFATDFWNLRNNVFSTDADIIVHDDDVTLFLNDGGEARFAIGKSYDNSDNLVTVKDVKGVDGETANAFTVSDGDEYTLATNTVFTLNGNPATFADLKVDQVVYVQANGTVAKVVDLFNTKVSGKVTAVSLNSKGKGVLTVNGTNYVISDSAYTADVNLDSTAVTTPSGIGALVNFTADLYLNKVGAARVVAASSSALLGKVKSIATDSKSLVVAVKGVETTYTLASGTVAGTIAVGDYVEVKTRADGKASSVTEFALVVTALKVKAIDTANKLITLQNTTTSAYTTISYSASAIGVRLGTWGDISMVKVDDMIAYNQAGLSASIRYFEVNPSLSGTVYGKVVGETDVEGTTYLYVDVKGEVKFYEEDATFDSTDIDMTVIQGISLNSDGTADAVADLTAEAATITIDAMSGGKITGTESVGSTTVLLDLSNAVIYKSGTTTLKALSDLKVDGTFTYVLDADDNIVVVYVVLP